jgi:hypothetical protein
MSYSSITNDNKPHKFVFVIIIKRLNQRSFYCSLKSFDQLLLFTWYTHKRISESALLRVNEIISSINLLLSCTYEVDRYLNILENHLAKSTRNDGHKKQQHRNLDGIVCSRLFI